ncbi:MAG: multiple sugar transport system substrate-binding protein [Kosmotogales bacterium]|nr:multiple sugar transport system substrate-binding protein [Kosmotogales bacterium]
MKKAGIIFLVAMLLFTGTVLAGKITLWKYASVVNDAILQGYVDQWNSENENEIELVLIPFAQYTSTKLPAAFSSGMGPDMFWISPGDFLRYANAGIFAEFDNYISQEQIDDMFDAAKEKVTAGGHIYGIPIGLEPLAIFYNKTLFNEYGLEAPKTWEEIFDAAEALKTGERWGIILDPVPGSYQAFTFYPWLWAEDGKVINDSWTESEINSANSIEAIDFFNKAFNEYEVSPKTLPAVSSNIAMLADGFAAMQECGIWGVKVLQNSYPDFEFGIIPIPSKDGSKLMSVAGGWIQVVNDGSKYREEAINFTMWLFYETDFLKVTSVSAGVIPTLKSVLAEATEILENPGLAKFAEIMEFAKPEPRFPPEIVKTLQDILQAVIFGGISPEEAANNAAKEIDSFLSGYKGLH